MRVKIRYKSPVNNTTTQTKMTTLQKQKMLIGEIANCYDRETGELLERTEVKTMDDAWTICCSFLKVEKGHLVMVTARLKYVFDNRRLSVIAND